MASSQVGTLRNRSATRGAPARAEQRRMLRPVGVHPSGMWGQRRVGLMRPCSCGPPAGTGCTSNALRISSLRAAHKASRCPCRPPKLPRNTARCLRRGRCRSLAHAYYWQIDRILLPTRFEGTPRSPHALGARPPPPVLRMDCGVGLSTRVCLTVP